MTICAGAFLCIFERKRKYMTIRISFMVLDNSFLEIFYLSRSILPKLSGFYCTNVNVERFFVTLCFLNYSSGSSRDKGRGNSRERQKNQQNRENDNCNINQKNNNNNNNSNRRYDHRRRSIIQRSRESSKDRNYGSSYRSFDDLHKRRYLLG